MSETLVSLPSISRSSQTQSTFRPATEGLRDAKSRPSTLGSNETRGEEAGERRRECLTSLSALYRSAYKPYQFTHMYGTHYHQTFQGRFAQPPPAERQATARFAPINYSSLKTTYQQEFRDKEPMGKALMLPCSRHRKNKPHPNLSNTWRYPDSFRWIWSEKPLGKRSLGTVQEDENGTRRTRSTGYFTGKSQDIRTHRWCSR
ncbi:uncharacterized protein LOC114524807 [Dendronephthya gigantea]|uniref:uncharacterized protein LOC114524807 n=1 Tax=Dendronephthya gigantea TaxID=151771 RepID=UPI00106C3A9E|nr:uncharacterized protein LOC114524807 [Dendronephthya gigantea]